MGVKRLWTSALTVFSIMALLAPSLWTSPSAAASLRDVDLERETSLVRITVPDRSTLDELVASDLDLTEYVRERDGAIEVDAVVTESERKALKAQGYTVETVTTYSEVERTLKQREQKVRQLQQATARVDKINILRAQHFANQGGTFLYVEAKTSAGDAGSVSLTATWTEDGEKKTATLQRKVDQNEYLYHHMLVEIGAVPDRVVITSNQGGRAEVPVTEWVGGEPPDEGEHYVSDFIDHYMTPTEVTARIEQLAAEFPELAEIVTLPYETNGYRRKAQALIGNPEIHPDATVVLTSKAWGHEGGNDITVDVEASDEANADLTVEVNGNHMTVNLATNASAEPSSTAADVVDAVNASAGHLVTATLFRNSSGDDTVRPQERTALNNGLDAPPEVSREPFEVKAIRIGKHRDGSKVGVMAYAQEHAREWVTPLVAVETAERLLRNYATDADTKKLVDNLDIFIVPTVNPDGGHYSFYDYNWQRKNMTNHCGPENSDPYRQDTWGVDLNRNHTVGSVYDGYIGASTNCTSGTYAGPEELSEPESRNLIWLAEENPNIQFAMNIHSYGGYFMWPPGAYDAERNTLPRPTAGEEAYFWQASQTILEAIKAYRGTVILPGRTGPIPDVLYSAAGNSADALWYEHGIYAWDFEVGADLWNPDTKEWEPVGFQPPFEEGHAEAMEFANGMIGLFEVAYQYATDDRPPHSTLSPGEGAYDGPVKVRFDTSEPATVYYTLDGSRPTFDSDKIQIAGTREGAETLTISKTTTIHWFSVDPAGNVEGNYDPEGDGDNYNKATIEIKYGLPDGINAAGLKTLIDRLEREGEITHDDSARHLRTHLTAVDRYERQEAAEKVVKHVQTFKQVLNHQQEHEWISEKAFDILKTYADFLLEKWQ